MQHREYLELVKRELEQTDKAEFDRVFLSQQLFEQLQRKAELTALRQNASGDLVNLVARQQKTCDEQLKQIRKLRESDKHK